MRASASKAFATSEPDDTLGLDTGNAELDEGDIDLLRWMRSLTSEQRLQVLQDFVDGVTRLRNGRVG